MLTMKSVNRELDKIFDGGVELVRGDGYMYFVGDKVELCFTTSVSVFRLNDLELYVWVAEAARMVAETCIARRDARKNDPKFFISKFSK